MQRHSENSNYKEDDFIRNQCQGKPTVSPVGQEMSLSRAEVERIRLWTGIPKGSVL